MQRDSKNKTQGNAVSRDILNGDLQVLTSNGIPVSICNLRIGDQLLGPDFKPRTVIGTTIKEDDAYLFTPKTAHPYNPWIMAGSQGISLRSCMEATITPDVNHNVFRVHYLLPDGTVQNDNYWVHQYGTLVAAEAAALARKKDLGRVVTVLTISVEKYVAKKDIWKRHQFAHFPDVRESPFAPCFQVLVMEKKLPAPPKLTAAILEKLSRISEGDIPPFPIVPLESKQPVQLDPVDVRRGEKDPLHVGIKVTQKCRGDCCIIQVDGDGLFLLGNFVIAKSFREGEPTAPPDEKTQCTYPTKTGLRCKNSGPDGICAIHAKMLTKKKNKV